MKNFTLGISIIIAIAAGSLFPGCIKKKPPPASAAPRFQRDESSLAGMVKQERTKIENDFRNLAIYYRLCADDRGGQGPAKWEDLKSYIGNDLPSLVNGIEEKRYVVIFKSRMGSNDIIAYEKQADAKGFHVVLYGDGHIVTITSEDLEKATQGKKK